MKIFDCFIFLQEFDLLELRLQILNDVVDVFVLCEDNYTHTGKEKGYLFEQNIQFKEKIKPFLDKIQYVKVSSKDINGENNAWNKEYFHRASCLPDPNTIADDDIICISDLDEIPNPKVFEKFKTQEISFSSPEQVFALKMNFSYYFFNCRFQHEEYDLDFLKNSRLALYKYVKTLPLKAHELRTKHKQECTIISEGGWHFSYLASAEEISNKIKSFSHQEFNNSSFSNISNIRYKMDNGLDLFDREFKWKFEKLNETYPEYLLKNQDKYSKYIKEID